MSKSSRGWWFERPRAVAAATWSGLLVTLLAIDPFKVVENVARVVSLVPGFEINGDVLRTGLVLIGLALIAVAQGPTILRRFARPANHAELPVPLRTPTATVTAPPSQTRSSLSTTPPPPPLRVRIVNPQPGDDHDVAVRLRVDSMTGHLIGGCTIHLVDFQRVGGQDERPLPPPVELAMHKQTGHEGIVPAQGSAWWNFLHAEERHRPEGSGGPLVRRNFFIVRAPPHDRLSWEKFQDYPIGPGTYIARVEVRPGNSAIETASLVVRVEYTGDIGLKAS